MQLDARASERLCQLLDRAGVSSDCDSPARARRIGLPAQAATAWAPGTWRHALDRLLAGYAVGDAHLLVNGMAPEAGATAPDAELLGRWAGWWENFADFSVAWNTPRNAADWASYLHNAAMALMGDDDGRISLKPVLTAIAGCGDAGRWHRGVIAPEVILDALVAALGQEAAIAPGLDGRVVVSGLAPFRAIPARVVVLMGMADGLFPRRNRPTSFDPTRAELRPGERDPRADDRQLFLDAVLAAGDRLIVTAPTAMDCGDRAEPTPVSTCVEELLAAAADALPIGADRNALVATAPLQPFSAIYLDGSLPAWDQSALDLASVIASGTRADAAIDPPFFIGHSSTLATPLPTTPLVTLSIAELTRFWRNPAAAWLEAALALRDTDDEEEPADEDPLTISSFAEAGMLRELIQAELHGVGAARALSRLIATGRLPLGETGAIQQRSLLADAHGLLERVGLRAGAPASLSLDLTLELPHAVGAARHVRLIGEVPGRREGTHFFTWTTAAQLRPQQRIEARIRQLAAAAIVGAAVSCVVACRKQNKELKPQAADPRQALARLCADMLRGRCEPLPFFAATSLAAREASEDAQKSGLRAWTGDGEHQSGEHAERGIRLLWRGRSPEDVPACWLIGEGIWSLLEDEPAVSPVKSAAKRSKGKAT